MELPDGGVVAAVREAKEKGVLFDSKSSRSLCVFSDNSCLLHPFICWARCWLTASKWLLLLLLLLLLHSRLRAWFFLLARGGAVLGGRLCPGHDLDRHLEHNEHRVSRVAGFVVGHGSTGRVNIGFRQTGV